ncbi:hypothetical protein BC828DRAFT_382272 [Blastocladiella britannica]|nr:hypothetical protein BC828DRAFT_382272 [Blastocladiella britannica]
MVKTELFAHMLRAWSSALHGSLKPRERIVVKRETVIKIVLGRVKALFPPDYIKYSDISGLAYYDELDMTDNDFDPEPLPPSGPPVSAAGTGAAAKKKKASAAATSSSVVTLPAEKTSSAVPKSTTTAKRRRGSGDASSSVVVSALPTLPPPVPPGTPATTPASSLEPTPKRARPDPSLQPQQQRSPLVLPPRITHAPSPSLAARAAAAGGALTPIAARSSPLGTKSPLGASAALFPPPTSVAPSWAASPLPSLATTTSSLFGGTSSPRAVVVTAGGGRETTPPNLTTTRLAFPSPLMTTAKNALHSNGGSPPGSATTAAAAGVPMPVGPIAAALHATPPLALPATASMIATTTHGFSVPPPMQPIGGGGHKQPSA